MLRSLNIFLITAQDAQSVNFLIYNIYCSDGHTIQLIDFEQHIIKTVVVLNILISTYLSTPSHINSAARLPITNILVIVVATNNATS